MMKHFTLFLLLGVSAVGSSGAYSDNYVTYSLTDVELKNGGDATGSLTYDTTDSQWTGWDVDVFNKHGSEVASFTSADSTCYLCTPIDVVLDVNGSTTAFTMLFNPPHSPFSANLNVTELSLFHDGRTLTYVSSGTLDPAPVPLPASAWLMLGGVVLLGATQWRRARPLTLASTQLLA
jgi:hypothetical protein